MHAYLHSYILGSPWKSRSAFTRSYIPLGSPFESNFQETTSSPFPVELKFNCLMGNQTALVVSGNELGAMMSSLAAKVAVFSTLMTKCTTTTPDNICMSIVSRHPRRSRQRLCRKRDAHFHGSIWRSCRLYCHSSDFGYDVRIDVWRCGSFTFSGMASKDYIGLELWHRMGCGVEIRIYQAAWCLSAWGGIWGCRGTGVWVIERSAWRWGYGGYFGDS